MQRHTCSQSDISTGSQLCPTIHLGVFLNFHSPQQLFKTFSTLLKLPTPQLQFSHSQLVFLPPTGWGKQKSQKGKSPSSQPSHSPISIASVSTPFLFAICLIQEVTLLQPKFSSLPQALYLLTSYLLWVLTSLWPLLPVSSLPPLSSCSCQLAFKHAHTENRQKWKPPKFSSLPAIISIFFSWLNFFNEWPPLAASVSLHQFHAYQELLLYESSGHFRFLCYFSLDFFRFALICLDIFPLILFFVESSSFAHHGGFGSG